MRILIAGSSSTIARAIGRQLKAQGEEVFTLSREGSKESEHLCTDLSVEDNIPHIEDFIKNVHPDVIFCCNGLLHNDGGYPEKSLKQLSDAWLQQNLNVNLLCHMHLARAADSLVSRKHPLRWISLSAMVGSIEDNHLGGWYSYRISKAALNMFIRTLSIEWGRRSPASVVVAQHPGTTVSALSEPFAEGIPEGRIYSAEQTAERLIEVMRSLNQTHHGRLLHWDGRILPF
ncbi:MAG TPA: cell-cell signaling protein CsgA [Oceanospirillales bacterium]|nr:cell-cell signaling protein CsgA [Oceanospirillaceae bacterium]HBS41692.1 cell-cell signaling protein CsgA [Oceanospirillales bacterium]|tara:strand:+ start:60143 stop:60835 length:693 start_codon:yes stop_codon:yes gene_type:complete